MSCKHRCAISASPAPARPLDSVAVHSFPRAETTFSEPLRAFVQRAGWRDAAAEPLTGDASVRNYYRLRQGNQTAVLMDAARNRESVAPFVQLSRHLRQLGFSAPDLLAGDEANGLLLLEDFGDDTFARLLESGREPELLFALATDVLSALHQQLQAVPPGLRAYTPDAMLADLEVFLEWRATRAHEGGVLGGEASDEPAREDARPIRISRMDPHRRDRGTAGGEAFRAAWRQTLPRAFQVPTSLLLRDYHVANLMLLPGRQGIRQVGLLDFQDAYQGPISYDLVSLLEDARRDLPAGLKEKMLARYLSHFPALDRHAFETSLAILAAVRHTRVLGVFERLSRREGRHEYKQLHSPRVERLLRQALNHPELATVKRWFDDYAW